MQEQMSSFSTLPENISFDHSTTSSDAGIGTQLPCNGMQASAQSRVPEYRMSSSETVIPYLQPVRSVGWNAEWSIGEASSGASQGNEDERKPELTLNNRTRVGLTLDERRYEPSNILSLNSVDGNPNGNHTTNGLFLLQNSSSNALPRDLNVCLGFGEQVHNECRVIEHPPAYKSVGTSSGQMRYVASSSAPHGVVNESEGRSGCSLDGRHVSRKRKMFEGHIGQSSGVGSLSSYQKVERSQIAASDIQMRRENGFIINNGLEQTNLRPRFGAGGPVSANPYSLTTPAGNPENSCRNFRLRYNNSNQQQQGPIADNPLSANGDGNINAPYSRYSSRLATRNRSVDLNPAPIMENISLHGQSVPLPVSSMYRSHSTRWSRASSSSSASAIPAETLSPHYEEPMRRNIPQSISKHPMFIPVSEMGNTSQTPVHWNLADAGGNNSTPGTVVSRANSSRRSFPQYPGRLSEIVRRSILSSAGTESGGQSTNPAVQTTVPMSLPSRSNNRHPRGPSSRSALWDRHLDGTFGLPYSMRTLAAASEGRGSIMSEIHHVLDLMRRGEGIRFEDAMMLDHTAFFGIPDRHHDMRLDVDNMSYEELLALEERMGNVCTGLNEETIMSRLKLQKYANTKPEGEVETEPCSICREEYNDGEDLGLLECGHKFHADCIKQWLMQKNLCPICKTAGLTTM